MTGVLGLLVTLLLGAQVAADSPIPVTIESPTSGANVSGVVNVIALVNESVENVTFFINTSFGWEHLGNGTLYGLLTYNVSWDTIQYADGAYDLMANASLTEGGFETSTVEDVIVDNKAPGATFTFPKAGGRLRGVATIVIQVDEEVESVEVFIIGEVNPLGDAERQGSTNNWTLDWDTSDIPYRTDIVLSASAKDFANNTGIALVVGVEIDNTPPELNLEAPKDNETLTGSYNLTANCTDPNVVNVSFEWRSEAGPWRQLGNATWNGTLSMWVLSWDLHSMDDHDDVEVRVVAVDDLGLRANTSASNLSILNPAPSPAFQSHSEGEHITGITTFVVWSDEDTQWVNISYKQNGGWKAIGQATQEHDGLWRVSWDTSSRTLHNITVRSEASDGRKVGVAFLTDIEVDNTPPEPRIIKPSLTEYLIYDNYTLVAISDRDTVGVTFHYLKEEEWHSIGEAVYNSDTDRWVYRWNIQVRVPDSAICATAVDEVGLVGYDDVPNIEIGLEEDNDPPIFLSTMDTEIVFNEDVQFTLQLAPDIYDDKPALLRAYVTGEDPDLFTVMGENVQGELDLRFIPVPNAFGTVRITVIIVDEVYQSASINVTVTILSVPDKPVFELPPNLYVHPDVTYQFDYGPYISDVDSAKSDLKIIPPDSPNVLRNETNPMGLIFTYSMADMNAQRVYPVSICVEDPDLERATRTILITVTEDWVPELRRPLPSLVLVEDQSAIAAFNLDDYFFDRDKDSLYYSYGNTHVTIDISDEYPHPVSIYLPPNWYGEDIATFRATDPTGALIEDTITIEVHEINDPPVFDDFPPIPEIIQHYQEPYFLDLFPYVIDVDDELWDLNLTTNNEYVTRWADVPLGLRFGFPSLYLWRNITVTVTISDNVTEAEHKVVVRIRDNLAPVLESEPPSDLVLDEGGSYPHAFEITSAFDGDWVPGLEDWRVLTFEFHSQHGVFELNETGWVNIYLVDPDWNTFNGSKDQPELVIVRVRDHQGAFSEYKIRLHVLPVNDPPTVADIPDVVVEKGVLGVKLSSYIRDVDTPFSSLLIWVEGITNPTTGLTNAQVYGELLYLNFQGAESHTEVIKIWISDGEHVVNTTLTIEIRAPEAKRWSIPLPLFILVLVISAVVALFASKFLWGRFEPPSVQDVYFVYGDGVIIRHLTKRGAIGMDEDLAIAMLTAIQEFVQQSMRSAQLKSMQAGENNILIERDRDRRYYIAVIHTGGVSDELTRAVNRATKAIREKYREVLGSWDGNIAKFDGVEDYLQPILVITHAHIPEGVRFEQEGITSIEPGKTFMFQGKDVTRTHNIFRGLVEEQGSGLLISRVHPQRLHPSIAEAGAECIWLSKTPTKRGVSPSNTTMILHEITTHVRDNENTIVCLDGLEHILANSPKDEVLQFLTELTDMVQVENFVMMVHLDPSAIDEGTLARISREMVPVTDQV